MIFSAKLDNREISMSQGVKGNVGEKGSTIPKSKKAQEKEKPYAHSFLNINKRSHSDFPDERKCLKKAQTNKETGGVS